MTTLDHPNIASDPAVIERAAEAIYRKQCDRLNIASLPWPRVKKSIKDANRDLARAALSVLPSSEEAVRADEREQCAKVAKQWLENWAADLFGTRDGYIDAQTSGKHGGRPISKEAAKAFAANFRERAEAVDGCVEDVATAIRARAKDEANG